MPIVLRAIQDHAPGEVADLSRERQQLLERAAALSREIATLSTIMQLAQEHEDAEDNTHQNDGEKATLVRANQETQTAASPGFVAATDTGTQPPANREPKARKG